MQPISLLKNTIQPYLWGSLTAIPELLGTPSPAAEPQAELWMGAHAKAPSRVVDETGTAVPLNQVIASAPRQILGMEVARCFHNQLPYLFKVLAAGQPLSVQAHPDQTQARKGFEQENAKNIPLDAPHRNYKDPNHKPECLCALTPFWALCGFRPIPDMLRLFNIITPDGLEPLIAGLSHTPNSTGLKYFYEGLLALPEDQQAVIIHSAVSNAQKVAKRDPAFEWMVKLHEDYPQDMGILAPLLLNLVRLEPGQALYLGARELHAYLEGLGIELMANSDNVLRGGLTPKHVDVPELLKTLVFREKHLDILQPTPVRQNEALYVTPAAEFALSVITLTDNRTYTSPPDRSVEILLCTNGGGICADIRGDGHLEFKKGDSLFIPAAVGQYTITGNATLYKAAVPQLPD
jgi:mannose-6-phosphate isomerase